MKPKEGDTFLYRYPYENRHLMLIVSKVISQSNVTQCVCTMVSSWKDNSPYCDPACILNKGDHPFIEHRSYIAYSETTMFREDMLINLIEHGEAIPQEPLSEELLVRIKASAERSKRLPFIMRQFFK